MYQDQQKQETVLAAVYARVSTLKQSEQWHMSLDAQVQECLDFAVRNGFTVDPQCIIKEPYTATTLDRPAFERLLADMVRRRIRHLIMDKPDRVTREGQVTAAYFIRRLKEIGVTLHLALSNFTVRDELTISVFLNYAFAAKLDNDQRVANVKRAREAAARALGRYVKGNRPPYGWNLEASETSHAGQAMTFKLVHHPVTYPVLLRMLHERQAGYSYMRIASGLSADGIPTSAADAGIRNAAGKDWHSSSVKEIICDPINAGIVTAFRHRSVVVPPDARHAKRRVVHVSVPESEQIPLPSDIVVDPPLTPEEYRWLLSSAAYAPRTDGKQRRAPNSGKKSETWRARAASMAMGYGGLFHHAKCGGTMRVNYSEPGKLYTYYSCQRHHDVPERCPGVTCLASTLDDLVWNAVVREVLLVPGKLEELAEEQRQADMAGADPTSEFRRLQSIQAELLKDQESLLDSIQHARSDYVRRLSEQRLSELGPNLAKVEVDIADAGRRYANEVQRQAILSDVQAQVGRYALVLHFAHLLPTPERVQMQRRVLRALGFRATVDKTVEGALEVDVELRLAAGQPGTWFTPEESADMLHSATAEGLTGLLVPGGTGLETEEPVSEQALLDFLHESATRGKELPSLPRPGKAASVGTVRFVTTEASPEGTSSRGDGEICHKRLTVFPISLPKSL